MIEQNKTNQFPCFHFHRMKKERDLSPDADEVQIHATQDIIELEQDDGMILINLFSESADKYFANI